MNAVLHSWIRRAGRPAWRTHVLLSVVVGLGPFVLGSCAKQGAPPGGPVDKTPPELVESTPESGSTGVPVTAQIHLLFSEKLDRRSLERGLATNPRIRWTKGPGSGPEVNLTPVDSLYPDTTYVITLAPEVQDRRSNPLGTPWAVGFSTGRRLDRAALAGRVVQAGKGSANAGIWLDVWDQDREWDPEVDVPYRQTGADAEGYFTLPFLRPGERAYQLFAYRDANRTGAFEEGDPWGMFPEPLTVAAEPETTLGAEITLWDSRRTGSVSGTVTGEWEHEGRIWLEVSAPGDSSASRSEGIRHAGPFVMCGIPAGKYLLSVYQDVNGNETWDLGEELREPRVSMPDTLEIVAGEMIRMIEVRRQADEDPQIDEVPQVEEEPQVDEEPQEEPELEEEP